VAKPYQRQGVGSRLARAGLERARALGYRAVFVQGRPAYYGRFGFVAASAVGLISPFQGVADPDNMALEGYPGSLAGLAGRVIYPPEWAPLM
jgi:putative acetyltransferase